VHRGRIWHGQLPLRYHFSLIDMTISLIVPLDNLNFAHDDVRVMTDNNPWDHPTEENIVSRPCNNVAPTLTFRSVGSDEGISLRRESSRPPCLLLCVIRIGQSNRLQRCSVLTRCLVSGHALQVEDWSEYKPNGLIECSLLCLSRRDAHD
jgi:hypothetical protein